MNGDDRRMMKVSVISPTRVGFEGGAESVIVPAYDGLLGILYNHAPMMVLLGDGELVIRDGEEEHRLRVSGGFLQVVDNVVSVLAEEVGTFEEGTRDAEGTSDGVQQA